MEPDSTEFNRLLSSVTNLDFDAATMASLQTIATSLEDSERFVAALLAKQSAAGDVDEVAVERTNRILEALGDKSELLACIFMAHLAPAADRLRMHDIWDSIDLWCFHNKSPELSQYLLRLAASQSDDDMRRHYEEAAQ